MTNNANHSPVLAALCESPDRNRVAYGSPVRDPRTCEPTWLELAHAKAQEAIEDAAYRAGTGVEAAWRVIHY